MKINNKNTPGQSYTRDPHSFILNVLELQPNVAANYLNIAALVNQIDITEGISSPFINVRIKLTDAASSIIETYKINGGERLRISLQRKEPPIADNDFNKKDCEWLLNLRITAITEVSKKSTVRQHVTIEATNEEAYHNASTVLDRSYSGSPADIVASIIKSDLKSTKNDLSPNSQGIISGIFPNRRPIPMIKSIQANCFDDGTPFFCFTTAKKGMRWISYAELLKQKPYCTYTFLPYIMNTDNDEEYVERLYRILSMSGDYNMSKIKQMARGVYASNVKVLDPSTKSYTNNTYVYDKTIKKLNKFAPYNQPTDLNDLTTNTQARNLHILKNKKAYKKTDNLYGPSGNATTKSFAYSNALNFLTQTIQIPGNFNLEVGMIIELSVKRVGGTIPGDNKNEKDADIIQEALQKDRFLSCKYLITGLQSTFTEDSGFNMLVTLQTDSLDLDVSDPMKS
jgi:hypothetical protein